MLARITSANSASLRLHARHGFVIVGVESQVACKHDHWLDVTIMQLPPDAFTGFGVVSSNEEIAPPAGEDSTSACRDR